MHNFDFSRIIADVPKIQKLEEERKARAAAKAAAAEYKKHNKNKYKEFHALYYGEFWGDPLVGKRVDLTTAELKEFLQIKKNLSEEQILDKAEEADLNYLFTYRVYEFEDHDLRPDDIELL